MGFRSLRLALDRQGLLRIQIRALLQAANGGPMKILVPMVTDAWEFRQTRLVVNKEVERLKHAGQPVPSKLELGAMIEVPSLGWELDQVLPEADFVSIGMTKLSMSPPSIGPIKEMILGTELTPIRNSISAALLEGAHGPGIRELLLDWAGRQGLVI